MEFSFVTLVTHMTFFLVAQGQTLVPCLLVNISLSPPPLSPPFLLSYIQPCYVYESLCSCLYVCLYACRSSWCVCVSMRVYDWHLPKDLPLQVYRYTIQSYTCMSTMLLTNTLHSAVRLVDNVPGAHQIELSQLHARCNSR